jgi:hypothetical protein
MQLTGKLVQVLPAQTGQSKNGEWRKQEIVLETDGQYPKKVCVSVWGDRLQNIRLEPGDVLTVDFDLESREYNGRWYTDVKAWKVTAGGIQNAGSSMPTPVRPAPKRNAADAGFPSSPPPGQNGFEDDDLPF